MSVRNLPDADCGRVNPVVQLTGHLTSDHTFRETHGYGQGFSSDSDQLVEQFLQETRAVPQTFQMDSTYRRYPLASRYISGFGFRFAAGDAGDRIAAVRSAARSGLVRQGSVERRYVGLAIFGRREKIRGTTRNESECYGINRQGFNLTFSFETVHFWTSMRTFRIIYRNFSFKNFLGVVLSKEIFRRTLDYPVIPQC